jgi:hypothetical protein
MAGAADRAAMVGDDNGAGVVFGNEGWLSGGETEIAEKLAKVFDILSSVTSGDDIGL